MSWTDAATVPPPPPTPGQILRKAPTWVQVIMLILAVVWGIMVLAMLASGSFNLLGFVVELPILTLLTIPIARKVARSERNPEMAWFVMAAFSAKMLGGLARYYFTYVAYVSSGDAEEYHDVGVYLVPFYRSLDFSPPIPVGPIPGTGFLETVTGILYSIVGTSKLGAFTVFAWFGFLGLLLCWRAFRRAVPDGDPYRYGLLVLFLPSLLYWSSALGKDAWALMGLGLCAYGVARALTRKPFSGLLILVAGLWCVVMIRPHVGLTVMAGLVLAALLYKPHKTSPLNPIVRVITFGILFVIMVVLISQTEQFLGVETLNQETVNTKLSDAEGRTGKEDVGSVFTPVRVNTPIDLPFATVTVLFRPFPWEAHNAQALFTSFEGLFIVFLMVRGWRRIIRIPWAARRESYIAYCIGITLTFIYAFSSFSNFGILARQRCQVMPFFLALICLNEVKRKPRVPVTTDMDALADEPEDPYARFKAQFKDSDDGGATDEHDTPGAPAARGRILTRPGMAEPDSEIRRRLDEHQWAGSTPRLELLGFDVVMRATDAGIAEYLTGLYAPLQATGRAEHVLTISSSTATATGTHWDVHLDGTRLVRAAAASIAFSHLLFEANRQAIEWTRDRVLVHASAAVRDGIAIVMPGPMGAGKSTLAAALVRAGSGYLTDELVAIDPVTGVVHPYPKYLSLGDVLDSILPAVPPSMRTVLGDQRLVAPDAIRAGSVAPATPPRLVVAPRYRRGAATTIEPLRPAAALSTLAQHAFHLDRDGPRGLETLATTVERSLCFEMVSGDIDDVCDALIGLFDRVREPVVR